MQADGDYFGRLPTPVEAMVEASRLVEAMVELEASRLVEAMTDSVR